MGFICDFSTTLISAGFGFLPNGVFLMLYCSTISQESHLIQMGFHFSTLSWNLLLDSWDVWCCVKSFKCPSKTHLMGRWGYVWNKCGFHELGESMVYFFPWIPPMGCGVQWWRGGRSALNIRLIAHISRNFSAEMGLKILQDHGLLYCWNFSMESRH